MAVRRISTSLPQLARPRGGPGRSPICKPALEPLGSTSITKSIGGVPGRSPICKPTRELPALPLVTLFRGGPGRSPICKPVRELPALPLVTLFREGPGRSPICKPIQELSALSLITSAMYWPRLCALSVSRPISTNI